MLATPRAYFFKARKVSQLPGIRTLANTAIVEYIRKVFDVEIEIEALRAQYESPNSLTDLADILAMDSISSCVDLYETVLAVVQASLLSDYPLEVYQSISTTLSSTLVQIADWRLDRLRSLLQLRLTDNFVQPLNESTSELKNSSSERDSIATVQEIEHIARALSTSDTPPETKDPLPLQYNEWVHELEWVLSRAQDCSVFVQRALKRGLNFRGLDFGLPLKAITLKNSSTFEDSNSVATAMFLASSRLHPSDALGLPNDLRMKTLLNLSADSDSTGTQSRALLDVTGICAEQFLEEPYVALEEYADRICL
jgi:hypothetical protein